MGFLKKISRLFRSRAGVQQLPPGSITVDRDGQIVTSTVSSAYPKTLLREIGQRRSASCSAKPATAQMPLAEISIHFGSLRITARELRGGADHFPFPANRALANANLKRL